MAAARVVVIGGGIAGLAAAHELLTAAPDLDVPDLDVPAFDVPALDVTVLEADERLGGKIRTSSFAGIDAVDEGPDAFLARLPWATGLARAVGLGDDLIAPTAGTAAVWWDGLQPIPAGLLLGLPTDALALARSPLISWRGKIRAAAEPLLARTSVAHDSIGRYVRSRFGDEIHERLVDPLVGSIYATDTDRFSLQAVPQLADLAAGPRSVVLSHLPRPGRRRATPAASGPVFLTPRGGLGDLVTATADAVRAAGGSIRTGAAVTSVRRDGTGWRVDDIAADAVVLACPAPAAARLLAGAAPAGAPGDLADAVAGLALIDTADVVMVTLAVPRADWPARLAGMSGYLVPKPRQRLVTAVSFGSQKWPHWRPPADDVVVLRVSLGRDGLPVRHLDDDAVLRAVIDEVGGHLGVALAPTAVRITRWDGAFPQYRPHHHRLVARLADLLPPSIALAGASYHGIGIPACVRSGQRAAATVRAALTGPVMAR